MLALVGIGIEDEDDISIKGMEALQTADVVYGELYTCPLNVDKAKLDKKIGKKIVWLGRKEVEEENTLVKEAENRKIAFLVGGDPLAATTHHNLMLECKKLNIKTKIFHASSIFSAIADTGLFLYKFGKTVSLPMPSKGYEPTSPYENILFNKTNGMHTLLLLDIGMTANEAIPILQKMDKKNILESTRIIVAAHLGEQSLVAYGKSTALAKIDFGKLPHSIIIPGELHFHEIDYLELFEIKGIDNEKIETNKQSKKSKKKKSKNQEDIEVDAPITF